MMGKHHPMERAGRLGYGKADGGLLVLSAAHPLIEFAAKPLARLINETKSACIQCQLCTDMCPRYLIGHTMRPHRVMRAIQADSGGTDLLDALACCECGICELFACPMGLSPRRINVYVKGLLRAEGAKIRDREVHREQTADREHRRIAQSRFVERWQLSDYPAHLDECVVCEPETVIIATRHGIGRPASPQVGVGDAVRAGQVIATVAFEDVGALVHASINGSVTAVDADSITIARTRSTVP
jgi:Na+-translocating ferredoxin:NAD+ oxidoreductase RnfC subunit